MSRRGWVAAGMMAAGTFVLSPLPRASMVYLALMLAGSLAALWRAALDEE